MPMPSDRVFLVAAPPATNAAEPPPAPKDKDGKVLPALDKLAELKGDATRGAAIYRDEKTVNCIRCHQVADKGGEIGPPLTTIGEKLSRVQMLEATVYPSNAILMGYENWFVKTKDGEVYTGLLSSETDDTLSIKDLAGMYIDIDKTQIVTKKQQPISIMPEGLSAALTQQELVDLLEYLVSLRNP